MEELNLIKINDEIRRLELKGLSLKKNLNIYEVGIADTEKEIAIKKVIRTSEILNDEVFLGLKNEMTRKAFIEDALITNSVILSLQNHLTTLRNDLKAYEFDIIENRIEIDYEKRKLQILLAN